MYNVQGLFVQTFSFICHLVSGVLLTVCFLLVMYVYIFDFNAVSFGGVGAFLMAVVKSLSNKNWLDDGEDSY
jgi:hypothetical protein